jgi:hypothetical protein
MRQMERPKGSDAITASKAAEVRRAAIAIPVAPSAGPAPGLAHWTSNDAIR